MNGAVSLNIVQLPRDIGSMFLGYLSLEESLRANRICQYFHKLERNLEFEDRFANLTVVDYTFLENVKKRYSHEVWIAILEKQHASPLFSLLLKVTYIRNALLLKIPSAYDAAEFDKFHEFYWDLAFPQLAVKPEKLDEIKQKIKWKTEKVAFGWYMLAAKSNGHGINYRQTRAQNEVGRMYNQGIGVERDDCQAFYWFHLAAENDLAEAQHNVGYCYHHGLGVLKDIEKALHWFSRAAQQNNAGAQTSIGHIYQYDYKEYKQAAYWYQKAANQNHAPAQNNLGYLYFKGLGVEKDPNKGFTLYLDAALKGNKIARSNVGFAFTNGFGVAQDEQEAVRWFRLAANQGETIAQLALGTLLPAGKEADHFFLGGLCHFDDRLCHNLLQDGSELSKRILAKIREPKLPS